MPGGDRTGPLGLGPMTGRAAGYCAGYSTPGYMNPLGGRGLGLAWRRGYGRGGGRGFRRGFHPLGWGAAYPLPIYPPNWYGAYPPPAGGAADELEVLKQQADHLESTLEQVKDRIEELEKKSPEKE